MTVPKIMIAGTNSGVGKTTISLSIISALVKRGLTVQPFKVGPDYIDPIYHSQLACNQSINLDTFLTSKEVVQENYLKYSQGKQISIIEGVMGLFDGYEGDSNKGSSAEIASILNCPVILVINAKAMARSAVPIALGFTKFDENINISGIIINNVASARHHQLLQNAFQNFPIPIVGYIYRNSKVTLPEGPGGLLSAQQSSLSNWMLDYISDQIDIDKIIQLALKFNTKLEYIDKNAQSVQRQFKKTNIAVAYDKAFHFYYQDELDLLKKMGAQLTYFSLLTDKQLPQNTEGVIIGGGFPETFLPQLASNKNMQESIKAAYLNGMPIYAEYGGYMYLTKGIKSLDNGFFPMVGIVPCEATMSKKLVGLGYRSGYILEDSVLGADGTTIKGHEFHYSTLTNVPENFSWAFKLFNPRKQEWVQEGYAHKNLIASYLHVNWLGCPALAVNFIDKCIKYGLKRGELN